MSLIFLNIEPAWPFSMLKNDFGNIFDQLPINFPENLLPVVGSLLILI
jgi:hypothetical protein